MKRAMPSALGFLDAALDAARAEGLLRERRRPAAGTSFCSNDYLGLADRSTPAGAARGCGASRLVAGERPIHAELESAAAQLVGASAALVFSSGYAANVGTIAALARPGDVLLSDALNHASIIDGARLSRATVEVFPHLDTDAVASLLAKPRVGRAFVLTESYFGMDADSPDLRGLRDLCDRHDAVLYVDEAHALGVLGPEGRGLCADAGVRADVLVGTFGKAFGAGGAFVAGCDSLVAWLWNRARSFVFSTGLSPAVATAALEGVRTALSEPALRESAARSAAALRAGLQGLGMQLGGHGHVVPWIVGDARDALRFSESLAERGVDVVAIRPPSVPAGRARLRFTATARHSPRDIERVIESMRDVLRASKWRPE